MTDRMDGPDPAEDTPALSIGLVLGGTPETDEFWKPEIQRLMNEVMREQAGIVTPLSVNVVFHVDGRLLPPVDFEGVRTGRLSRKTMELMVQAAVPVERVEEPRDVVTGLLMEAVTEAEALARRRGIADGLPTLVSVVRAVSKILP